MKTAILTIFAISQISFAAEYKGVGAESLSPETVKKFAPPPITQEMSRKIQTMLDVRSPGMGMISGDGKKFFFGWSVTGTPQVWRLDRPMGFPAQMTGGEDRTGLIDITPDGSKLLLSRDRGGEENPGLYWQSTSGGPLTAIQHKAKVQTMLDFVSDDSERVYFHANDIKNDSYAIYRYSFKTQQIEKLFSQDGLWSIADQRGEKTFLLAKSVGSLQTEYYEWQIGTDKLTPIVGQNDLEEYRAAFSNKPGEYLVLTPKFGDFRRLYRYKNGKYTPASEEANYEIGDFSIDHKHEKIYLQINDKGYGRIKVLNAATLKPLPLPVFKGADQVSTGASTRDGRYVTIAVSSGNVQQKSYIYDWKTKTLTQWHNPSTPEVDTTKFAPVTLESYTAEDGTAIPMFVRRPAGCADKVCPVIVSFHGGPEAQTRPSFSLVSQLYVEAGYIYVEPNVRGSDGYGKTWLNSDNGPKRLGVITDIRDAGNFIRKNWAKNGVEPKIGVTGGSYGGYSTQVAMTMFAGTYDAGVSNVGMSNLLTFLNNTAPYRRILRISEYGDPEKDKEALNKLSPTTYIGQVKAPMMLIQGLNDPRVPAGEAVQMYESMVKRKIPSQLVIFPDEGHGSAKRDNQVKTIGYALEFFGKYLH